MYTNRLSIRVTLLSFLSVQVRSQMVPPGISPEDFVLFELKAFELDREQFQQEYEKRRSKRTVMFNGLAPIDLGMLFGIPLSLALPSLSNFFQFNLNKEKVKRNAEGEDEILDEEHPILQSQVEHIESYFQLLNIPERRCQERAICEFSADPTKFFPVSELIQNRLRQHIYIIQGGPENTTRSLYRLYTAAAALGTLNGPDACDSQFALHCPIQTKRRLNMGALSFWNFLAKTLRLTLKDDLVY